MPRLSGHTVMGLASLLVTLTFGVVLFADLPAIIRASLARRAAPAPTPTSKVPATPASTPAAAPTGLTTPISTKTFRLQMPYPRVWLEDEQDTADTLESHGATTSTLDQIIISAVPYNGVGVIQPGTLQAQEKQLLTKTYGSVGTCVPAVTQVVGGVNGTAVGYLYSGGPIGGGGPACDIWWFGTNGPGNVEYSFETVAPPSDLPTLDPLAEQVRDSVTWLI